MKEKIFDYIIIMVSNALQKRKVEEILEKRGKLNIIPTETKYIIIVEKEKIGSGGAIFNLIKYFYDLNLIKEFERSKILLINSAGDSKRNILYADTGKIYIPTFRKIKNKIDSTIFDEIIKETKQIGKIMNPGILIVSGDCMTEYNKIFSQKLINNTAISVKANVKIGERHGVFVVENGKLRESLQKNTEQQLKEKKAVDSNNNVNIDTGIIYFNSNTLNKIKNIIFTDNKIDDKKAKRIINKDVRLNFYTDFIYPLSKTAKLEKYLEAKAEIDLNPQIIDVRKQLWDVLHEEELDVLEIEDGRFIHYGTVKEFIDKAFEINKNNYIQNSIISKSTIGKNTIIMDSIVVNKNIPDNLIIKTIKIKENKYTTIILGIEDNLKEIDYKNIKLFNKNIGYKLKEQNIINENNRSLWECKLYTIEKNKEEAIDSALNLYYNLQNDNYDILKENRLSIEEILSSIK